MQKTVIEVNNLVAKYGERTVLHDITTSFNSSEIKVVLGTSGCGKTTFLKHTIGLLTPAGGSVSILGTTIGELDSPETVETLKRIGVMYQYGALLGSLTVGENVALPLKMHTALPKNIIEEIVRNKLSSVGLDIAYDLLPGELSGGMRKRAAIARALVLDPPILFCDEPSAGLDPVTSAGLDDLLIDMRDRLGITIVVITHEIESIKKIADKILYLEKGHVLYDGSLSEALELQSGPVANFFKRRENSDDSTITKAKSKFNIRSVQ
jgi:phospholipid/cholesterol/gamma-HCH transport system ATP-binding protein